ncbi:hypothetical protein EMIHUDRAFT_251489 [Emiliania huxleyi CCMP1516]|uniref:J domain-containing protein n=2 Tax=Emiliania huxleyi TaxID=2903 RepID=A0A0D3KTR4_EMIH1|nr:hypothetical protein EMIHUDRAFT_251489 [Emiliania huxleyi CCMP1516]EOD39149.1 hypothetical protein EMIHUDRAFT_251489 [Emiliania huxleyi CCMP1516]|eukprot:XP_005791578.1 hypothetical protein EMIHUDRAFT_251489 [Emiliania huxleyi CCMP1516]
MTLAAASSLSQSRVAASAGDWSRAHSLAEQAIALGQSDAAKEAAHVARVLAAAASGPRAVLRVSARPAAAEVNKAYHRLCVRIHPDKNDDPHAAQAFAALTTPHPSGP